MTRKTRPVSWIKGALKEFETFPEGAQSICLAALTIAAEGGKADVAKPMRGIGSGAFEIALSARRRNLGRTRVSQEIDARRQNTTARNRRDRGSFEKIEGDVAMKSEKPEVVRGSGNVFRDLGHENADAEQFKAILAAEIIKALDREHLTVRAAQDRTRIAAADFSRIRNADLGRFTVDRLISIINRLGSRVEVKIRVHRTENITQEARL
jgi:predicted XRE-type DNA-binding protein